MSQSILTKFTVSQPYPICASADNIYTLQSNTLYITNITTGAKSTVSFNSGGRSDNIAQYNNIIYVVHFNTVFTYNLQTQTSGSFSCSYAGWYGLRSCVHNGYLYYSQDGNSGFGRILLSTQTTDQAWCLWWNTAPNYSTVGFPLVLTGNGDYIYFVSSGSTSIIGRVNVSQAFGTPNVTADICNNFITISSHTIYGLSVVNGWLYASVISSTSTSKIMSFKITSPTTNFNLSYALPTTINYSGTNYSSLQNIRGIATTNNNIYALNNLAATSSTESIITSITLPPPLYKPLSTFYFDISNTNTVANGNLKVTIIDPSNTAANEVYYQYAVNTGAYINSGVYAGTLPYTFYITTTNIINTIYIKASNSLYDSDSSGNLQVIVYQTPRAPGQVSFMSVGSGNVQVTINESNPTPPNFYYLNNVSYYLYAYNTFGGTNLSGNTSTLVYNIPVGVLSNTNSSYGNVVSYVNTGLTANTYTMYVIAKNTVGNSIPVSSNIKVYTTPFTPTIDTANTISKTSGILTVSIIDPSNVLTNGVYYWYSIDGTTYINSNIANNGPTQTRYTFNITGVPSSVNTIYVYAKNGIGNSAPISTPVNIIGTPISINSYSTNFSLDNGITVSILDTNNIASNNVYYYYYYFRTGDTSPNQSGNIAVYSNSYVSLISGTTTYSFNIPNLLKGDYTVYVAAVNSYGSSIYTPANAPVSFICFKEDSRILTNKGYKKIQHLKKGDLVKTFKHGFKPIYKIGKKEIVHLPTLDRSKNHLYKCSTKQYHELFDDLVLTGCHSVLVDGYTNEEQLAKSVEVNGGIYLTEGKYRLPVCADKRATIYEHAGKYMVYHIALENDDYYMNYGIYANGLLVESTSKRFLEEMNIMNPR